MEDNAEDKKKKKSPENKAAILQSLRTKLNNLFQEDGEFLICILLELSFILCCYLSLRQTGAMPCRNFKIFEFKKG